MDDLRVSVGLRRGVPEEGALSFHPPTFAEFADFHTGENIVCLHDARVCVGMFACVRACVSECVCVCVFACVRACVSE